MLLTKIKGNIEGIPFILIQHKHLPKWNGFYASFDLLKPQNPYPDLEIGNQKYKMYEGDDFENPITDWGFVIDKMLKSQDSPLLIQIRDFEVLLIDPTIYTAWEGYHVVVVQDNETYYFVFHLEKEFEIESKLLVEINENMNFISSVTCCFNDNKIRILATTEHGLDNENQIFADIDIIPGTYKVDLFQQKSDYPRNAIYKMDFINP